MKRRGFIAGLMCAIAVTASPIGFAQARIPKIRGICYIVYRGVDLGDFDAEMRAIGYFEITDNGVDTLAAAPDGDRTFTHIGTDSEPPKGK